METATAIADRAPSLRIARGARATEVCLLDAVRHLVDEARGASDLLARPIRIVVPSRSLRDHVAPRIAEHCGGAVVGVLVQTLHGLACEVLDRAGVASEPGDALFPLLAERAAKEEPALYEVLEGVDDGYQSVVGAVADFLDAGLEPELAGAAAERLASVDAPPEAVRRACALLRTALRSQRALRALGRAHRSDRLRAARDVLARPGAGADDGLPARAIVIHGFADATGVALDLIEALCRLHGAVAFLDVPADLDEGPAARAVTAGAVGRFTAPLAGRVGGVGGAVLAGGPDRASATGRAGEIRVLTAPSVAAETRAVAARILERIERGVGPEQIGVVARSLSPYTIALRRHFGRLGIPFSSPAAGPAGPEERAARALLTLIRDAGATAVDPWLDATRTLVPGERADLRIALHALGAGRVADVAALDVDACVGPDGTYRLPVRRGLARAHDDDAIEPDSEAEELDGPEVEARSLPSLRRCVSRRQLAAAAERARDVIARLGDGATASPVAAYGDALHALAESLAAPALAAASDALAQLLPPAFALARAELARLIEGPLLEGARTPLGGHGAGVQVLDAMAARGRTFAELFVLGLDRGLFPRTIQPDALLADPLRLALRQDVLESFPVKERGFDEERYLFADLLSAAPKVMLSWHRADDSGSERAPSPLLELVRLRGLVTAEEEAPALLAPASPAAGPRTAHEQALACGIHGNIVGFREALPVALAEALRAADLAASAPEPGRVVAARLAILAELDRPPDPTRSLGAYFGFVGRPRRRDDPRQGSLFVTTLERAAACGWQAFLERLLHLEPVPDALGALPSVAPLLVGKTLHLALERLAEAAGVPSRLALGSVLGAAGVAAPGAGAPGFDAIVEQAARDTLREESIPLPALASVLSRQAKAALALIAALEGAETSPPAVLGVEVEGVLPLRSSSGASHALRFRADRVERAGSALRLVDFKYAKPLATVAGDGKRAEHLEKQVAAGARLQAIAYALAAGQASGEAAIGRYVFARAADAEASAFDAASDAPQLVAAFEGAVSTVLDAFDQGAFAPRLVDAKGDEPRACTYCAVSEACLRGDSGARHRFSSWAEARSGGPWPDDTPAERALRNAWRLREGRA